MPLIWLELVYSKEKYKYKINERANGFNMFSSGAIFSDVKFLEFKIVATKEVIKINNNKKGIRILFKLNLNLDGNRNI